MSWLLNTLHRDLGGTKKARSSMIYKWFQGESEVFKEVQKRSIMDKRDEAINREDERAESYEVKRETSRMPFLMLDLDFPPPPLFNYAMEKNIILQVQLF